VVLPQQHSGVLTLCVGTIHSLKDRVVCTYIKGNR
jgi:hypothetical protein